MQELSVITVNGVEYSIKDEIARQTVSANGIIHSPNADYAEIGEWADGNPGNENRVGYFVCVDNTTAGITMTKAKADSDVRGVTMLHPGFSGNAGPDKFDSKGELLPQYNYVGFIPVIDNGRCRINDRCMPSDDGTAVPSSNNLGYQVIDRVDSNRVLILVEPQADMIQRIKVDMDRVSEDNVISVEGVQTDIDTTDDAIADILLSKCDSPVYSRSISQGAYSTSTGQIFETTNCCCSTIYAYTDSRTFICANGYKVQMLFYGSATGAGYGNASAYTGTYTGWSRICTIPALTYVALNFRREDNGLIVPDDLVGNYFRLMSEHVATIDETSTDTQYPSAKAVYDAINTYSIAPIEQLTEDKDATDSSLADVLIGSGYLAPHNKNLQQGTFSRTDGRKLSSANVDYYKRVRTIKLYAYGDATTFVCAEGYKMRMYYYGVATAVGGKEDTTTYTGKYTGWSRVITFPPMEYIAFVIKADDDREIAVADVTDKIYKYVPPTILEPVSEISAESTDVQVPSAKAVYDAISTRDNVFVAVYGTTTYAEIADAYNAGKTVHVRKPSTTGYSYEYDLVRIGATNGAYFSTGNYGATVYYCSVTTANVWASSSMSFQNSSSTYKVTSISGTSTDTQYPTAKAVYTAINNASTHITASNQAVATGSWASDDTYTDYPYRAQVAITDSTVDHVPEVIFSPEDAASGIFAPISQSYAGGVYIYASEQPTAEITIPAIYLWR